MEHPRREIEVETVQSAARRLGVCPKTVRRMISDGRLPAYRLGPRMLRLDPADALS
ncbi:helix-turn-helix domain-containing protein [Aestuariimicrobium ganziense]|uniref:helix-turn-helix domain-containing protein n=1 Tax=Aestuariimicrobium ganziense TaxID=2773677 RepID=UPI0038B3BB67